MAVAPAAAPAALAMVAPQRAYFPRDASPIQAQRRRATQPSLVVGASPQVATAAAAFSPFFPASHLAPPGPPRLQAVPASMPVVRGSLGYPSSGGSASSSIRGARSPLPNRGSGPAVPVVRSVTGPGPMRGRQPAQHAAAAPGPAMAGLQLGAPLQPPATVATAPVAAVATPLTASTNGGRIPGLMDSIRLDSFSLTLPSPPHKDRSVSMSLTMTGSPGSLKMNGSTHSPLAPGRRRCNYDEERIAEATSLAAAAIAAALEKGSNITNGYVAMPQPTSVAVPLLSVHPQPASVSIVPTAAAGPASIVAPATPAVPPPPPPATPGRPGHNGLPLAANNRGRSLEVRILAPGARSTTPGPNNRAGAPWVHGGARTPLAPPPPARQFVNTPQVPSVPAVAVAVGQFRAPTPIRRTGPTVFSPPPPAPGSPIGGVRPVLVTPRMTSRSMQQAASPRTQATPVPALAESTTLRRSPVHPVDNVEMKIWQWLRTIPIGNGAHRGWDDRVIISIVDFAYREGLTHLGAEELYRRYVEHQVEQADEESVP
eukprot:TRINITY_DN10698_c0_g1_i1.p1 TRINITY_DN10698_c0_g1~~TRINITY_DN10698_c0_g1_i1.p1  ORF type:complete len:542 (+),score=73.40 TRINITY_DN10698_c0_g1_i1:53-1678(+)